ncbi:heme/hemin ABC transporter substrate-binding protein [Orrella marina]|uniref:heme/hemin ABC transporter substrate-binding protein n=1 Tax=Orrella marina TaxID=2163011 RepID=UPI001D1313D1|nr:ABC transporter substrate-binding protein [Orrella marina]
MIGTDQSSIYPPEATELPSVGYYRKLPSEGVVSLRPSLIVASENAGPPEVIEQLKQLGISVVMVSDKPDLESLRSRVETVARALGKPEQGKLLLEEMESALASVEETTIPALGAMTIVMRGGKLLGAGADTAANVVLETAGLKNVLAEQNAYRPLSAEVVSALAPDVIIVTSSTVESMGGVEKVKQSPVIAMTPAVQNSRVIVLDDMLAQGFGLRFPQAIAKVQDGVLGAAN